jgi:hypothetical protein
MLSTDVGVIGLGAMHIMAASRCANRALVDIARNVPRRYSSRRDYAFPIFALPKDMK